MSCYVCNHGWTMTPLNWGKSGDARRRLCERHLADVRKAERADLARRRAALPSPYAKGWRYFESSREGLA